MLLKGEWRNVRQSARTARSVAFWFNTLYSPFTRFSEIAREFMKSKDDPDKLHNFANSWLAEPWEDTKLKTSADLVQERQTELEMFELPPWTKLLTGGVDVQETSLYWTIRAWGDYSTSQNIANGQAASFGEVVDIMNLEFKRDDGQQMLVDQQGGLRRLRYAPGSRGRWQVQGRYCFSYAPPERQGQLDGLQGR